MARKRQKLVYQIQSQIILYKMFRESYYEITVVGDSFKIRKSPAKYMLQGKWRNIITIIIITLQFSVISR